MQAISFALNHFVIEPASSNMKLLHPFEEPPKVVAYTQPILNLRCSLRRSNSVSIWVQLSRESIRHFWVSECPHSTPHVKLTSSSTWNLVLCNARLRKILKTTFETTTAQTTRALYFTCVSVCLKICFLALTARPWHSVWNPPESHAYFYAITSAFVLGFCDRVSEALLCLCTDWLYNSKS